MPILICQTHFEHLMINKMNSFGILVLFGLLAMGHARPEVGYSYQRPQILPQPTNLPQINSQPLQLSYNQGQQGSFQQSLPIIQQSQPLQQSFSQVQQGSSYQQSSPIIQQSQPLQLSFNQGHQSSFQQSSPIIQQSAQQGYSYQPPQFNVQVQQPQPQLNVQLPQPQPQLNVQIPVPQGNLNHFQSSLQQSLPQIPIQPQVNYNQVEQSSSSFQQLPQFNPQPSFQNQDNVGQNLLVSSHGSHQEISGGFTGVGQNNFAAAGQNNFAGVGQNNFAEGSSQQSGSLVTKHISIHVAPEDPEEVTQFHSQSLPARKNYKIIFIKAPSAGLTQSQIIAQQAAQVQEKTLVYVLVNKPQSSQEILLQAAQQSQVSKPEVYFIKYKSKSSGIGASLGGSDGGSLGGSSSGSIGAGLPIVEDRGQGQGQLLVNSGESTSSLFSGGLSSGPSTRYGVPGYQKRSTQK